MNTAVPRPAATPFRWAEAPNRSVAAAGTNLVSGDAGHGGIFQNYKDFTRMAVAFLDA